MKYIEKFIVVILMSLVLSSCSESQANKNELPNIIWIVSEDNSIHYSKLYDENGASMPNIEKLAEKGIVFNHAFSNAPVCSVARSTIISGCYAPRVGAQYHRAAQKIPLPGNLSMFPSYLRQAGYYTTNNSKEDYNFVKPEGVWDDSSKKASYRNRKGSQPFFHVQNFGTTHEGKLHFSEEDMKKKPTTSRLNAIIPIPYFPDDAVFRYTYAYYKDLHVKVDQQIGVFLDELEADGMMENTIIFYYGDHGGVLPRSKGYVYDSGLHVPMVVYVPEKWKHLTPLKKGSRSDAFIQFIDLGPTVLNIAGIDVPPEMDGKPFLGKDVQKSELESRNETYGYADRFDEKYDLVRSYRKGKHKYIRNYQPFNIDGLFNYYRYKMLAFQDWESVYKAGNLNEAQSQFFRARAPEALYDLEHDPHEINNLATLSEYQSTLKEMRENLQKHLKSTNDLSFYPEPYFIKKAAKNPTAYGNENQKEIADLIDLADLSLSDIKDVRNEIKVALESDNPLIKYWALIVCSTKGAEAQEFMGKAKKIFEEDENLLVRTRALEFLVLNNASIVEEQVVEMVFKSTSETEASLMLNTIALLEIVNPNFDISLIKSKFNPAWVDKPNDLVNRRANFINQE